LHSWATNLTTTAAEMENYRQAEDKNSAYLNSQ